MSSVTATRGEADLVARLRAGDEEAFGKIVETYYGAMLATAQSHVGTRALADEVVHDAWLKALDGLDRFDGRGSLKSWLISIVVDIAGNRAAPPAATAAGAQEPAVAADRFRAPDDAFPGHWWAYPADWSRLAGDAPGSREALDVVTAAIAQLPDAQRIAITMRDIAGCSAADVCRTLDLTDAEQRRLLHRARSRVRAALERHLHGA